MLNLEPIIIKYTGKMSNFVIPKLVSSLNEVEKRLIYPLHGGGSGNTQQDRGHLNRGYLHFLKLLVYEQREIIDEASQEASQREPASKRRIAQCLEIM
jgi:hypothetical protein